MNRTTQITGIPGHVSRSILGQERRAKRKMIEANRRAKRAWHFKSLDRFMMREREAAHWNRLYWRFNEKRFVEQVDKRHLGTREGRRKARQEARQPAMDLTVTPAF